MRKGSPLAAAMFGVKAVIAMPADAPAMKTASRKMGAEVVPSTTGFGRTADDRSASPRTRRGLVPPFDDPAIIAGQGTVGLELMGRPKAWAPASSWWSPAAAAA